MTLDGFLKLAWNTVTAPQDVAKLLISTKLSRDVLWMLFALVVVVNTLLYGLTSLATPMPDGAPVALVPPAVFGALLAGSLAALTLALTWCGKAVSGTGRVDDFAILIIWMQALRGLVQLGVLLLMLVSPALAGLLVLLTSALGLYILVNFIVVGHALDGAVKAVIVLLLAIVGIALVLSMMFSLLGISTEGMLGSV